MSLICYACRQFVYVNSFYKISCIVPYYSQLAMRMKSSCKNEKNEQIKHTVSVFQTNRMKIRNKLVTLVLLSGTSMRICFSWLLLLLLLLLSQDYKMTSGSPVFGEYFLLLLLLLLYICSAESTIIFGWTFIRCSFLSFFCFTLLVYGLWFRSSYNESIFCSSSSFSF